MKFSYKKKHRMIIGNKGGILILLIEEIAGPYCAKFFKLGLPCRYDKVRVLAILYCLKNPLCTDNIFCPVDLEICRKKPVECRNKFYAECCNIQCLTIYQNDLDTVAQLILKTVF